MPNGIKNVLLGWIVIVEIFSAGCTWVGKNRTTRVTLGELPRAARATAEKVIADGQVEKITREIEKSKVVYDVEAIVAGKHMEFLIADADGALLGTEATIEFAELPEAVRSAAEKYFGGRTGLKVMKGVEYGETSYEIEGIKNGKTVEVTFDPAGKRVE